MFANTLRLGLVVLVLVACSGEKTEPDPVPVAPAPVMYCMETTDKNGDDEPYRECFDTKDNCKYEEKEIKRTMKIVLEGGYSFNVRLHRSCYTAPLDQTAI